MRIILLLACLLLLPVASGYEFQRLNESHFLVPEDTMLELLSDAASNTINNNFITEVFDPANYSEIITQLQSDLLGNMTKAAYWRWRWDNDRNVSAGTVVIYCFANCSDVAEDLSAYSALIVNITVQENNSVFNQSVRLPDLEGFMLDMIGVVNQLPSQNDLRNYFLGVEPKIEQNIFETKNLRSEVQVVKKLVWMIFLTSLLILILIFEGMWKKPDEAAFSQRSDNHLARLKKKSKKIEVEDKNKDSKECKNGRN